MSQKHQIDAYAPATLRPPACAPDLSRAGVGLARIEHVTSTLTTRIRGQRVILRQEPTGIGPLVWTAEFEHGTPAHPRDTVRIGSTLAVLLAAICGGRLEVSQSGNRLTRRSIPLDQGHLRGTLTEHRPQSVL